MIELAGGDILLWAEEGGPIMLKTVEKHGDPVELSEHEAEELIGALKELVANAKAGK